MSLKIDIERQKLFSDKIKEVEAAQDECQKIKDTLLAPSKS